MPRDRLSLLAEIRREQRVLLRSRRELKPLFSTAEHLGDTYEIVSEAIIRQLPNNASEPRIASAVATIIFLRFARRTVAHEFLALARRQWPESLMLRRRAMELVAFAAICWTNPGAARAWREANRESPASRSAAAHVGVSMPPPGESPSWTSYMRAFTNARIKTTLREFGMAEVYDQLSALVHPSLPSVVMGLRVDGSLAVDLFKVELLDDHKLVRPGHGRALSAERMIDAFTIHAILLYRFVERAFSKKGWEVALPEARRNLDELLQRIGRDGRHYRHRVAILNAHRRKKISQIARAMERKRGGASRLRSPVRPR